MEKFATGTTRKMEENTEECQGQAEDKARKPDKDKQSSFFV